MHWLAIHLPRLPLEVFSRAAPDALPLAVSDVGGRRLLRCNRPALARGVRPGLSPAAARALAADLRILARDPAAERAALEQLAAWALQFSSRVSLESAGLLLEAAGSRRLFGGARALQRRVAAGLESLGYRAQLALAPTPLGASLLAAARHPAPVADAEALRAALARLPLAALVPEPRSLVLLQGFGLSCIGDLLRLPRAGLARRLGPALPACLDRALGRAPDPRPDYRPPARFRARLALPAEVSTAPGLLFPGRRLLLELAGFLSARGLGAQALEWRLEHESVPASRFSLGLLKPERDSALLLELLRQRLERLELAAPVFGIELRADLPQPLAPRVNDLFAAPETEADPHWLERVQARIGRDGVRGIRLVADHRPELAWAYCPPGSSAGESRPARRPLWLLPRPQPLERRAGRPWYGGRLRLGPERERIHCGWWDGREVARDYFEALGPGGERLWIYRELGAGGGWFLHGIFA